MKIGNWRRLFQFHLSTLLLLSLAVSITAVIAHRNGFQSGVNDELARHQRGKTFARAYAVQDLVLGPGMTKPDFDRLTDVLVAECGPDKWDVNGGPGSMAGFDTNYT